MAAMRRQVLQQGRAPLSAEVKRLVMLAAAGCMASTGPRSFERGGDKGAMQTARDSIGFNRAALL